MRTLFEGGYRSRGETIRGNTVTGLGNCSTKEKQKEAIVHFTALLASLLAMQIPVLWDFATIIFDALRGTEGSIVLYVSL